MRRLLLIGIGAGHPDHVTVQAINGLNAFDVLFLVTKQTADELVTHRLGIVERHRTSGPYRTVELLDPPRPWRTAPDYVAAVNRWRRARVDRWQAAIGRALADGETGAFLVWGDPSVYESTLSVIDEVARDPGLGLAYEVIPGVSSIHALTARYRISLNRVGRAVQLTPARLLRGGLPPGIDDVVVLLDPDAAFARIPPADVEIYWAAYLGTADEVLISGPLAEVSQRILVTRDACRARIGWLFDIYLLRRVD